MPTSAAECLETGSYCKPLSVKAGPSREIEVSPTIEAIGTGGIRNTVPAGRATVAPVARKTPTEDNKTQTNEHNAELEETLAEDTRTEEENVPNARQDFAKDCLVRHVGKGHNFKYVVHCYSYTPTYEKVEPPAHIHGHLISRFFRWMQKPDAGRQGQRK